MTAIQLGSLCEPAEVGFDATLESQTGCLLEPLDVQVIVALGIDAQGLVGSQEEVVLVTETLAQVVRRLPQVLPRRLRLDVGPEKCREVGAIERLLGMADEVDEQRPHLLRLEAAQDGLAAPDFETAEKPDFELGHDAPRCLA